MPKMTISTKPSKTTVKPPQFKRGHLYKGTLDGNLYWCIRKYQDPAIHVINLTTKDLFSEKQIDGDFIDLGLLDLEIE